jgi:precorrin-3B C17-methyltransferase
MTASSLFVIGVGPGDRALMTPQAMAAIRQAEVVIAYDGYLTGIADLVQDKECLGLALGQETQRAELAVQKALTGQRVCVVSSGDAGIYGMASLVLEIAEALDAEHAVDVTVLPGVSAINASACLLGAPLGHDFAVISLSDLLTPWPLIESRLRAAGEADFALALLNPRSRRRDWQLGRACAILRESRSGDTPAGVVRHAYRPGQEVVLTTLGELEHAAVDMFSTVIIGNSTTRRFREWLITPRGYASPQSDRAREAS